VIFSTKFLFDFVQKSRRSLINSVYSPVHVQLLLTKSANLAYGARPDAAPMPPTFIE